MDYLLKGCAVLGLLSFLWLGYQHFAVPAPSADLGATTTTTNNPWIFKDDITVQGRNLNVTSSNSATSTIDVGCVQTYATSTATPWKLSISVTGATTTFNGTVYARYGTCPSI